MKKFLVIILWLVILSAFGQAYTALNNIYSSYNCEHLSKWKPYHNTPKGEISCVRSYDDEEAIKFDGDGVNSGYILGEWEGLDGAWNDTEGKIITWEIKYNDPYVFYVRIMTTNGARYLYYTSKDRDLGKVSNDTFIHHGLGSNTRDGKWHLIIRDLEADLKDFEPNNELISINAFLTYGNGEIRYIKVDSLFNDLKVKNITKNSAYIQWNASTSDNLYIEYGKNIDYGNMIEVEADYGYPSLFHIELNNLEPDTTYHYRITNGKDVSKDYTFNTAINETVYEDAEDNHTDGWRPYHNTIDGTITNMYDEEKQSNIIKFDGEGTNSAYILGGWENKEYAWNNTKDKIISWDIKYNEMFVTYVRIMTLTGPKYLYYKPYYHFSDYENTSQSTNYFMLHGLPETIKDGKWHTITRDLEADLKDFEPKNKILAVNAFLTYGSGMIDNIVMKSKKLIDTNVFLRTFKTHAIINIDKNKLQNVSIKYGKNKYYGEEQNANSKWDTNSNMLTYTFENLKPNTIYHYKIFYGNGGVSEDKIFKTLKSDNKIVYENAEDGKTDRWRKKSSRTYIMNHQASNFTNLQGSNRLISFDGSVVIGGWEDNLLAWRNTIHKNLSWTMLARENYSIHVRVMTSKGARYLYYTPDNKNLGIHPHLRTFIHHGLGSYTKDKKNMYIITRNLESDLKDFEPDNELLAINGMFFSTIDTYMIVDDIFTSNKK